MELLKCGSWISSSFLRFFFVVHEYNLRCLKQCSGPSRPLFAQSRPLKALMAFTRSTYYLQNYCFVHKIVSNCLIVWKFLVHFFLHFASWFESRIWFWITGVRVNGNIDSINLSYRRRRGRGYLRNRRQVAHWRYSGYPLTMQVSWSKKIACSIIY